MKKLVFILTLGMVINVYALRGNIDSTATNSTFETVNQATFDSLKQHILFDKTKNVLSPRERNKDTEEDESAEFEELSDSPNFSINGPLIKAIAYILIAGLVLAILYMIFSKVQVKSSVHHAEIELTEIEDIEEVDAINGYQLALEKENYRLALRMQFIKILQQLSASNQINWKPDKTNRHYIRETSGLNIHHQFRALAQTYEWVWYGNSAIGKETFQELNPQFESFHNSNQGV